MMMTNVCVTKWLLIIVFCNCFTFIHSEHKICELCTCDNNFLNCVNLGMKTLFSDSEWTATVNSTPTDINIAKIREAQFSRNEINRVKKFPQLSIIKLDLSRNEIILIENGAFEKMSNLTELDISHNEMTNEVFTPDIFKGEYLSGDKYLPMKLLKKLDLGNNLLTTLDNDIFEHLPALEELSLSGNPIKIIDNSLKIALKTPESLKILDISFLGLKDIPDKSLPISLEIIRMIGNDFFKVPKELLRLKSLRVLYFDENPIITFNATNGIQNLPKLEELYISNMQELTTIDAGAFKNLTNLKKFNCSYNPFMSSIDSKTFSWKENNKTLLYPPIKELMIHDDGITTISNLLVRRWDNMDRLDIGRNLWLCDCSNQWVVSNLISLVNKSNPTLAKENMCYFPEEMNGWTLENLHKTNYHMRCLDTNDAHPENDGAMLIGLLIGMIIAIPITLGSMLLWIRWRRHLGYQQASTDSYTRFYKPNDEF